MFQGPRAKTASSRCHHPQRRLPSRLLLAGRLRSPCRHRECRAQILLVGRFRPRGRRGGRRGTDLGGPLGGAERKGDSEPMFIEQQGGAVSFLMYPLAVGQLGGAKESR